MRDFLDAILAVIDAESLTDEEFETLDLSAQVYDLATYTALQGILSARDGVSDQPQRLEHYFLARGVDLSGAGELAPGVSHILIGDEL